MSAETEREISAQEISLGANRYLGKPFELLTQREQAVFRRLVLRRAITRDSNQSFDEKLTSAQRLADQVAKFGGSWTFIIIFAVALAVWVVVNLIAASHAFDPYPFIFLNLILSMLAAVQAPVIMMSQNRHSAKDRVDASHDYEVNLKAEIEIMALHDKLDELRSTEVKALVAQQQEQIAMLTRLVIASTK
ncbi:MULTISPECIES: DUF1003 domain-containing protein [unclassified Rhizobium]|uniref:DUF1003 domain-containing protein n=1 Tax=unclassified Rhizobium TaxID=2613769 RepID=UPI000BE8D488|nr:MULTISPECIES: DUF1003 domain-containing protein [unclassified Rhizobium]MDF0664205.1 DUF1003 domain-containing protein [Rhizobium sp. BC49]PDS77855.1 hypothetical protein CO654_33790 [Rhizobium sp. L18]